MIWACIALETIKLNLSRHQQLIVDVGNTQEVKTAKKAEDMPHRPSNQAMASCTTSTHLQHELGVNGPVGHLGMGLEAAEGTQVHVPAQEGDSHRVLLGHILQAPHELGALSRVLGCSPVVPEVVCSKKHGR